MKKQSTDWAKILLLAIDHRYVGVELEQGCRNFGSDGAVASAEQNILLCGAVCNQQNLLGTHNGHHTHGYRLLRNFICAIEETRICLNGRIMEIHNVSCTVKMVAGLIESDVTVQANAKQLQVVFRYNNSTLEHLKEDYQLPEIPSKDSELFDVTLLKTTDLTPDNKDDNAIADTLATTRYFPTAEKTTRTTTSLYTYYRFVFDGVSVDDVTVGVFADVYYLADLDYTKKAYGTLCLYWNEDVWIPYVLSSDDLAALGKKK